MKKKIIYLLVIAITLSLPGTVKAACTSTELARLKKIAANISYDYTYQQSGDYLSFTINLHNIRPEIYVYDFVRRENHYNQDVTTWGNAPGISMSYIVRARGGQCSEQTLYNFYINLPQYNKYYNSAICSKARDYKMCDKWYNNNSLSEKAFNERVQSYIDTRNKKIDETPEEVELTWQEILFEFVAKYYLFILIPLLVIPLTALIILKRRQSSKYS